MAPLPENNTDRIWLKYTANGVEHEIIFRFPSVTPQADQVAAVHDFAVAAASLMHTSDSFSSVRHQDSGSTVSFPLSFTPVSGTNTTTGEPNDNPHFLSVTGRSLDGRRCKLGLYVPLLSDNNPYRVQRAAGNIADIMLDAVEAMEPAPVSISGGAVIWNNYANTGYNAYWQRQERKGL